MPTTIPAGAIVVGVDGSTCADLAVDWGAQQALAEGRPLVLVHAACPPSPAAAAYSESPVTHAELVDALNRDAQDLLTKAAGRVGAAHPLLKVHLVVLLTDGRVALLDAATRAGMLVVGTRGLGPVRQLLLGSVSMALVKHASAPVVVVRPHDGRARERGILVGVAGEDGDATVVELGFRVAAAHGLPVTLLHSFWDLVGVPEGAREVPADEPGCEDQRAILHSAAKGPSELYPSVPVRFLLSRGFADVQLIHASRDAQLLVLGHRRKPFLRELVYGSVAPRVAEHADCSVAVVPLGQSPVERDPATA